MPPQPSNQNQPAPDKIPSNKTVPVTQIPPTPPTEAPKTFTPVSPFGTPEKKEYAANPLLKTLRTYQGDVEETIHKKKESVVTIAVAEQKAKENPQQQKEKFVLPKMREGLVLTHGILPVAGLVLVILGVIALSTIYYYLNVKTAPVKIATLSTLVSYTTKYDATVNPSANTSDIRSQIIQTITTQKKSFNQPVGSVLYIHFTENTTDLPVSSFFQSIAPDAPGLLTRSLAPDYMTGIYSFDKDQTFIILSSDNYGEVYAGMLSWEASMKDDLTDLFPDAKNSSFATTTGFTDDTFNNKDVRVLRNQNGDIVLLYGFLDKNTLAITANEKIFQQLVTKYINSKLIH